VTRKARIFNWISSELLSGRTTAATVKSDGLSIHQRGSNRPQSSLRQSPFCTTFNRISGLLTRHNNTSARLPLKKIFSLLLHVGGASGLKESWIIQCNLRVWSNLHRVDRLIHWEKLKEHGRYIYLDHANKSTVVDHRYQPGPQCSNTGHYSPLHMDRIRKKSKTDQW
jgi:hypothetical protein